MVPSFTASGYLHTGGDSQQPRKTRVHVWVKQLEEHKYGARRCGHKHHTEGQVCDNAEITSRANYDEAT